MRRVALWLVLAASAGAAAAAADTATLLLQASNALRAEAGVAPLQADDRLSRAALEYAQLMARTDRYGHDADGRQPAQRVEASGYDWCMVAENIGWQYSSRGFDDNTALARLFIDGWQQSPPHRRNLLDARASQAGIATARSERSGRHYAVQLLARPCDRPIR